MSDERHRFVVGVDYGTTYSGAAYLHTKSLDYKEINVIHTWPGTGGDADNRTLEKAPTEISFGDGGNLWGYQLAPGAKRYGCFKLLLDAETGETKYDDPNLATAIDAGNPNALLALPPGKDVNEVTYEYFRLLYEHTIQQLRKRSQVTFDSTPIEFVLTTPAIWSHLAQDATCKAAIRAGFTSRPGDTITMVAEPEAAALYCLKELYSAREGSENPLQKGDRVLICDAGGGTVDLATYTITQTSPRLRVKEANVGSGGKCGSTTLDRAFLSLVESRIGERFKKWPAKRTGRGSALMTAFEMAKKGFGTSSHDQSWHIPVGNVEDDLDNGIEDGELELTSNDMAAIFDPVVKQIIELVASQIKGVHSLDRRTKVMTILLVGGFGESQYLFKKLKEWCEAQAFSVDVINPTYSWSAVVRGAVIHGIQSHSIVEARKRGAESQNMVESRKLKRHYGVILGTLFNPRIHKEEDSFIDFFTMRKMTTDNVEWLAEKGEDAENERRIPIPCFGTIREWGGKKLEFDLTGCDIDDAPKSPKNDTVKKIGKLKADLSSVPNSEFSTLIMTPQGRIFAAEFSLEMLVGSAELTFDLMYNGVSYGSTPIEY